MSEFFGFLIEPVAAGALRSILVALVEPLKFACVEYLPDILLWSGLTIFDMLGMLQNNITILI